MKKYNYILESREPYGEVRRGSINWANAISKVCTTESEICSMYDIEPEDDKRKVINARKRKHNKLCPILIRESHNGHHWTTLYYYLLTEVEMVLKNDY
jgi:hypothetical protein